MLIVDTGRNRWRTPGGGGGRGGRGDDSYDDRRRNDRYNDSNSTNAYGDYMNQSSGELPNSNYGYGISTTSQVLPTVPCIDCSWNFDRFKTLLAVFRPAIEANRQLTAFRGGRFKSLPLWFDEGSLQCDPCSWGFHLFVLLNASSPGSSGAPFLSTVRPHLHSLVWVML